MKQVTLALSIAAILLSGFLLFKQYSGGSKTITPSVEDRDKGEDKQSFRIAYFDIDSLQNKYQYFKDALAQLKVKEEAMNNVLTTLERSYQKKISEWQQKGSSMSQSEADAVQREYAQMQQNYQQRRVTLEQQLETLKMDYKKNIKNKIEEYLKAFNKDGKYSYIISYEPELVFYKDTTYNITEDLIHGLNEAYKEKAGK